MLAQQFRNLIAKIPVGDCFSGDVDREFAGRGLQIFQGSPDNREIERPGEIEATGNGDEIACGQPASVAQSLHAYYRFPVQRSARRINHGVED